MRLSEIIHPIKAMDTYFNVNDDSYHQERRKKDRDEKEHQKTKKMRKVRNSPADDRGTQLDIHV